MEYTYTNSNFIMLAGGITVEVTRNARSCAMATKRNEAVVDSKEA